MKLLIVAGPYEADKIRRAAVSAGFEAVAVEPGESLTGWITATRPDVIILAPQIVSSDPAAALSKVRAVPRGRVPIFLVGDAEEEALLRPLADGFFVRPVAPEDLLARAREAIQRAASRSVEDPGSGPHGARPSPVVPTGTEDSAKTGPVATGGKPALVSRTPTLRPLVAKREADTAPSGMVAHEAREGSARIAVPVPDVHAPHRSGTPRIPRRAATMFDALVGNIDADFDAEILDVVRDVGAMRQAKIAAPSPTSHGESDEDPSLEDLSDESSQKTLEVPPSISAALVDGDRHAPGGASRPRVARTAGGDEIDLDLPSLLARMYLSRLSGRLTLRHGGVKKFIVFERGHPVLAGSTRAEDRMGEMLVRQGRFTAEQMSSCGTEMATSGRRLGVVLVDRGLVKATELSALVRRHYEEIIHSLFAWDRGSWNLGTDNSAAAEKILLSQHPSALILEGIRRKYSAERALTGLGGGDRVLRLRLTTGASELLEKMSISPEERNLVLLFDGVRSLDEIRALTGAPAERLYGVAWALFVLERLDSVEATGRDTSAISNGHGPVPPAFGRDEAIDRALVQSRHALVVDGDYFQILGVTRDATAQEIRRAHEVLMAEMAPEVLHPTVMTQLETELGEIRSVLGEAARLMTDDRLRRQYREHLPGTPAAAATEGTVP